jgi:kynurenine 3-monooxygenase
MTAGNRRQRHRAVVIGAGPVDCLAAHFLARRGFEVEVYEKRADYRNGMMEEGRTINLSLSPRGLAALDRAGLKERCVAISVPMAHRVLHRSNGVVETTRYGPDHWVNYSVGRNALNHLLFLSACDQGVKFHFDSSGREVEFSRQRVCFGDDNGRREVTYDLLVGADGVSSWVRTRLAARRHLGCMKQLLDTCYAELNVTSDGGQFAFDPSAIHIWPRDGYFMIGLPNPDGTFKCTLVLPTRGEHCFEQAGASGFERFVRTSFPDVYDRLDTPTRSGSHSAPGRITTVVCDRMHHEGSVLLLGDAAHAIAPFLGQGINLGFEDCLTLDELLDGDLSSLGDRFTGALKENADAAAALSMTNYQELVHSDSSERSVGLGRHEAGAATLVVMVNFAGLSYAEVLRRISSSDETSWLVPAAKGASC